MRLSVENISLTLGDKKSARRILNDVSFVAEDGAFTSLLGESGAGKSTLLKVIAGILLQDAGTVRFDGASVDGLAPHKRRLGFVFQDVRLFPHMNVEDNVAYPLKMAGVSRREREARATELLERVQLDGFGSRAVQTLSGGQAQRVALARAIVARPAALLLDEPFSGLDESLREDMRSLLLRLQREERLTTVMVTHDAQEALMMSDSIVALDGGRVAQTGEPQRLYQTPATAKIAACFGDCSQLKGMVEGKVFRVAKLRIPAPDLADGPAVAVVRQEGCRVAPDIAGGRGYEPAGEAVVRCGVYAGNTYLARLDAEGQTLTVPVERPLEPGAIASVRIAPESRFVFPA